MSEQTSTREYLELFLLRTAACAREFAQHAASLDGSHVIHISGEELTPAQLKRHRHEIMRFIDTLLSIAEDVVAKSVIRTSIQIEKADDANGSSDDATNDSGPRFDEEDNP